MLDTSIIRKITNTCGTTIQVENHLLRKFTKDITAVEGGALIGVQIDITKRIFLDFFVGGGIRYTDFADTKDGVIGIEDYYEE